MLVYFFWAQAWGVCATSLGKEAMPVGTCTVSLRGGRIIFIFQTLNLARNVAVGHTGVRQLKFDFQILNLNIQEHSHSWGKNKTKKSKNLIFACIDIKAFWKGSRALELEAWKLRRKP